MNERVLVFDTPRPVLGALGRGLGRAGIEAIVVTDELPGPDQAGEHLLGAVVHWKRREAVALLRAQSWLADLPVIMWYPARTSARELSGWWGAGAQDLQVGPADAAELVARLKGLLWAQRARQPWTQEAMNSLIRISRTVTSREDDATVLSTTARELERLFPGARCVVLMVDAGGGTSVVTQGDRPELLNIRLNLAKYPEIQKSMSTRKSVYIRDVRRHPLMREVRDFIKIKDIISILAVPVFYLDEVIGLIILRSPGRPRVFHHTEVSFCEMVAQSTAVAVRNLRLGREVAEEVKRSREAIELAEQRSGEIERLETLFDHASDGIVMVDPRGRVKGVNVNFTRLSGFAREDVQGRPVEELLFPSSDQGISIVRALKARDAGASRLTQVLVCKDQARRYVAVRVEHLPSRRERLISMHDITEERELDEALRRTKEFLENVIQASMDAIIAADMNGTLMLMNRAAENISGYRAEDVVGRMSIVEFYAPGVARDIMRKLRSDDYGGKGKLESCYNALVSAKGEEIPINISASIIYEEGREVASVGIFQDLRERIRIEKELREAQDRLVTAQRKEALVALSGAASHELNQPLTSILGYAELLRRVERTLAEEMPDHPSINSLGNATAIISQEAERMANVVRKIGEIRNYETRDYVGGRKIVDLDRSRGEPTDEKQPIWQHLFQHMTEAVAVVAEDGQVVMSNPAAVVMSGANPVGSNFTRFFKGIEFTKAAEALEKVRRGEPAELDLQALMLSGEERMVHFRAIPLPGRTEVLIIYHDITESRRRETALRGLSAFQAQLLKNSTLPLIALDVDGRVTFWNSAAEKLFGYTPDEVRGKLPAFLFPKATPESFNKYFRELRSRGDLSGEADFATRSGETIRAFHVDAAMRDDENLAIGYLTMVFDLSRQKAAEQELREKTEQIAVMSDIAESIRSGVGLSEVLGGVLRKLARVFPVDLGAITIHDNRSRDVMAISYSPGRDLVFENSLRLYEDNNNVRRLLFMEQPAIIDDLEMIDGGRFSGDLRRELEHMKVKGLHSLIMVPLIFRNEVLGTLHVFSEQAGRYSHADLARISQLSGPITMALANARLFNQIQLQNIELSRRTAWMEDLIRAGQEISLEMKPEEAITHLVKPYFAAHSWQHLAVYQAWADGRELRLMAALNYPSMEPESRLKISRPLLDRLQDGHKLTEIKLDDENPGLEALMTDAKTALLVPMAALDRWLGLIVLESHHLNPFTENEKLELQVLGSYMAGVLRNLQFYGDLDLALRLQRALIENANALIFILDREGRVALINRALQELLAEPAEKVMGLDFGEVFERHLHIEKPDNTGLAGPEDDYFKDLFHNVEQGESLVNLRVTIVNRDGKPARCVFNTSSILDRGGHFQGFIAIGQNMTSYQELEKYLLQAEKLATIGQMAPGVAHELNNPLFGILAAAEMLTRQKLDDRSRKLVDQLTEEARRIETLAHNLMSYSRPSREEMFPLDLRAVVVDSLSFSRYEIQRGQVEVEVQVPSGLPPVFGIKDQLQQVFINLLTNASHACSEKGGGHITISAKVDDEAVEVRVSDTGVGIKPENIPRLFDPFFTTKPEGKGTGLGLSIVREIVSRHHGAVRAESVPTQGATFILTLPIYHYQSKR